MFTLEFEGLVKVFLARAGDKDQLLATLLQIQRTAGMMLAVAEQRRRVCVDGQDPWCQDEGHVRGLVADFLVDYVSVVQNWARRSRERVEAWADLAPREDTLELWTSLKIGPAPDASAAGGSATERSTGPG
jgi:hypothetical protein